MGGGVFKGTILDVKVDPVEVQETKQRIEIAQMNRTIKKMQNDITKQRRGDNYVENPRMPVLEKRRNPPSKGERGLRILITHKDQGFPNNLRQT